MNIAQKFFLAAGAIVFIIVIAIFPVKYKASVNNPDYKPRTGYLSYLQESPYMEVERVAVKYSWKTFCNFCSTYCLQLSVAL